MKKTSRKLSLSRETIANLNSPDLAKAVGRQIMTVIVTVSAWSDPSVCPSECYTDCYNCPSAGPTCPV